MTWHSAYEGCEVDVISIEPDVITISCVNSGIDYDGPRSKNPHRYHCTDSLVTGALMVIENDGFGNIRHLNGAKAKKLLVDDKVWMELPTYFRNKLKFA
jgi:hypothetical protein